MIRVLLVEDDPEIGRTIKYYLAGLETYSVDYVTSAEAALEKKWEHYHVILLDIMLPGMDGITLCRELRQYFHCPILFVSCLDDTESVVRALSMGGDDFLTKPFDCRILDARIQANIRRMRMVQEMPPLKRQQAGDLVMQPENSLVIRNGEKIFLSDIEYRLLSFMMEHRGEYFESAELYRILWGRSSCGDPRTVAVHVYNLRQKLEDDPMHPKRLLNIRGKGYTFVCD